MSKLNGVELKAIKTFKGHEGETCYQGNLYLNGKRLGFWSQDSWSGMDIFDFDESTLNKVCEDYQAGFDDDYRYKAVCAEKEVFISAVLRLRLIEKDLTPGFKKGYKAAIYVTDGFHCNWTWLPDNGTDEALLKKYSANVEIMKEGMFKNEIPRIAVFRPGEFDITIDKNHPAPEIFQS